MCVFLWRHNTHYSFHAEFGLQWIISWIFFCDYSQFHVNFWKCNEADFWFQSTQYHVHFVRYWKTMACGFSQPLPDMVFMSQIDQNEVYNCTCIKYTLSQILDFYAITWCSKTNHQYLHAGDRDSIYIADLYKISSYPWLLSLCSNMCSSYTMPTLKYRNYIHVLTVHHAVFLYRFIQRNENI